MKKLLLTGLFVFAGLQIIASEEQTEKIEQNTEKTEQNKKQKHVTLFRDLSYIAKATVAALVIDIFIDGCIRAKPHMVHSWSEGKVYGYNSGAVFDLVLLGASLAVPVRLSWPVIGQLEKLDDVVEDYLYSK